MPLEPGTRLGPYEVLAPIGAGGMGEVYRARDTRLDRTVAIKILPARVAADPERRKRFEQEARLVSNLNHPHICVLYDVGREGDVDFLVMEYLEGATLAERLEKGPLPWEQALRYAIQIADALHKAHGRGVVHRDLKPGNVILTKAGPKLLDFGLAKLRAVRRPESPEASSQLATPSKGAPLTREGTVLGTLPYMAPEQLEGKESDARTDLFAFGAVLYEMLTGRRAFQGETEASLIAAILEHEPEAVSTFEPRAPAVLGRIVASCLAKDPEDRWQCAHDLRRELQWTADGVAEPVGGASRVNFLLRLSLPLVAIAALALVLLTYFRESPGGARVYRFAIPPPPGAVFAAGEVPAVSPDGRLLAFIARDEGGQTRLWIRSLDAIESRPLDGTENASQPFWSPDGRFLAFFAGGKLKKIAPSGGPALTIADALAGEGGTWSRDGVIVFVPNPLASLLRVPASGGEPTPATRMTGQHIGEARPQFLPDEDHFVYFVASDVPNLRGVYVGSLDKGDSRRLFAAETAAVFAPPDQLLIRNEGALTAQRFDSDSFELIGDAHPVPGSKIGTFSGACTFTGPLLSVSNNGTLVYLPCEGRKQLVWVGRKGERLGPAGPPGADLHPWLSPDESRLAISRAGLSSGDIWLVNLSTGSESQFTFESSVDIFPVWSPDGNRLVFSSDRQGALDLYQKPASGLGEGELLLRSDLPKFATDWSADGRFLAYVELTPNQKFDQLVLPLDQASEPMAVAASEFDETQGTFSPDGRWLAYASDESGRHEIYVIPFPPSGGKWRVSTNGGFQPKWRSNGRELFYRAPDGTLMAVPVAASESGAFRSGTPKSLFKVRQDTAMLPGPRARYAVSNDGERFLVFDTAEEESSERITVVVNWTTDLE
jgi:Tol biopolymer transport system component/predicted Ser/Thr protein kinase